MVITFEELRKIKDSLPTGSMLKIAEELDLDVDTVRNSFGGDKFENGVNIGVHIEKGPNGGIVKLDNPEIYECALRMLKVAQN
ncbi:MAG: DNA-binding protein [Bacteroidetes bacterium]|nr:DNA-binding protein [Bacteroidota bacterium]